MSAESERDAILVPLAAGADGDYDPAGKSPREIEDDITDTRAQLGAILDEIERQLAPRHLLERGVDMLKDTMSGESGRLGEALREHPVALALIGAGIGWLAVAATRGGFGGTLRERVSDVAHAAGERAGSLAGQLRDKVGGVAASAAEASPGPYATGSAGYAYARQKSDAAAARAAQTAQAGGATLEDGARRAQELGSTAWQRAGDYAGRAGEQLQAASSRVGGLIEENPLLIGALGFLAGTAIALILPKGEVEERLIGDTGERLRRQAVELGREAVDRVQQAAERTIDAATDAVRDAVSGMENRTAAGASVSEAGEKEHIATGMSEPGKHEPPA